MNKTALITGASSGIGKELANIHAEKGGNLVIVARSLDKLLKLKTTLEEKHGVKVVVIQKDLTEVSATKEIYEEVKNQNIKIDFLINNAGFGGVGNFNERNLQEDISMIHLNITALTSLTHYFLQDFVANNSGKILNVMDKTDLFKKPVSAKSVAEDGYKGMLKGKLDVISGLTFSQKIMMATLPISPKKLVLKQIRKMQETK